jgi:hypothetical protein
MTEPTTLEPTPGPQLERCEAAALRLNVSSRSVRNYVANGLLTEYRIGPRLLFVDRREVNAMLRPVAAEGGAVERPGPWNRRRRTLSTSATGSDAADSGEVASDLASESEPAPARPSRPVGEGETDATA